MGRLLLPSRSSKKFGGGRQEKKPRGPVVKRTFDARNIAGTELWVYFRVRAPRKRLLVVGIT